MSKPTDFEKHIRAQLGRVGHLMGFPEAPAAMRDYVAALSVATTDGMVTRVMDEIISLDWDRCPSAARIRTIAYNHVEREEQKTRELLGPPEPAKIHCAICQDFGIEESLNAADLDSVASPCQCIEGINKQTWADRVNRARKILRETCKEDPLKMIMQGRKPDRFAEVYKGEF